MPTSELRKLMEDIERRRNETAPLKIINEVTPSDPVKEKTPEPLQIDKEALEASLAEMQKLQRSYVDTSDMGAFGKTIEFISRPLRKAMDTTPGRFVQNVSLGGARQILGDSEYGKDFEVSTGSEGADKIAQTVGGFTAPIAMMSLHGQPVGQAVQQTVMANPNLWNVNPNIISALRNIGTGVATMGTRDALSETFNPTWKDYAGSAAYMGLAGPVSSAVAPHVQYMAPGIHPLLENLASSFAGGLAGSVASLPFSWSDLEGEGFQKATSALKKVGVDAGTYALFGTMMMALQPEMWGDRSPQMKSAANNMMHSYNKYLEALQAENKTEADKYAKEFQRWGNTFFHYARQVTKQGATSAGGVQILDKQAIDAMKLFGDVDPNTITPENFRQVLDMKLQATPWSAKPGLDASGIDSGSDAPSATQQVRPVPTQTRTTSAPVSDTSTPTLATVSRSLVDSLRAFQGASEQNQGVALEEFIQAGNDFKNYVQGYDSLNEHPERNQFVQLMNELNMNAKDFISALQIHGELLNDLANQYDDIPIIEKSDSEVSASNVAEVQTEEPVNIALSQENLPEYNKQLRRFWGSARGKGLTTEESRAIWTMASGKESMKEGSADDFQRAINLLNNQEFNAKEVAQYLLAQQQPDAEVPTEQPKAVVPDVELTSGEQSPVEAVQAVDEPNLASGIENSEINLVKPENVDELQRGDTVYDPHGKEFEIVRVNKNSFRVKNAEGLETTLAKSVIRVGEQLPETATTEIAPVEQAEPQALGEEMVQVDQIPDVEVPGVESPVMDSETEKSDTLLGEVVRLARSSPDQWSFFGDLSERYKDRWKEVVDLLPEEGTNTPDKIFSFWNKATEGGSLYEGETYVEPQGEGTDYTIQPLEKVGNVEVAINENSDKIASVKQGKDGIVVEIGRGRFEEGELNEITLIHEIGHVLSSMHPDLERQIFENPGGALGRVNQQTNQFEGVYGMKTPEESWAESYRAYMMDPADLQKKHPDAFALVEHVLNQIPYHEELHSSILEKGAAALSGSQPPQVPVIDSQTEDSVNLMKLKNIDNLAKGDTIYDPHGREFEIIRVNKNSFRVKDSDGKETTVAKSVAMIRQEDVPQSLNTTIPRTIADVERLFRSLGAQDHHMKTLMGYIENSIDSEGERKFSHFAVNEDGSIDFLLRINMDDQWGQKTVYTNHRVGIVPGRGLYHYRPEHATLNQWLKSHENAIFVDDISIDGKPKPISVRQWETSPQDQATDYNTHLETLNRVQGLSKRLKPLGYRMKGTDVLSADTGKVVFRPNRSDNVHDELDELEHFIQEHEGGTSVIVTEDIPADQKTTVVGASGEPEGETEQKFRSVDAAALDVEPSTKTLVEMGKVVIPGVDDERAETIGRMHYLLQQGGLSQEDWDEWVGHVKNELAEEEKEYKLKHNIGRQSYNSEAKRFRDLIRKMGGIRPRTSSNQLGGEVVVDHPVDRIPLWARRKHGRSLDDIMGELAGEGFYAETTSDLIELLNRYSPVNDIPAYRADKPIEQKAMLIQKYGLREVVEHSKTTDTLPVLTQFLQVLENVDLLPEEKGFGAELNEEINILFSDNPEESRFHGKTPEEITSWLTRYVRLANVIAENDYDITPEEASIASDQEPKINLQFFAKKEDNIESIGSTAEQGGGSSELTSQDGKRRIAPKENEGKENEEKSWEEFFGELATGESGASTETSPQAIDSEEKERAAGIEEVINSPTVQKLLSIGKPKPVNELKKQTPNAKDLKKRIDSELEESDNDISLDPFAPQTDDVADFFATNKRNWKGKNPSEDDPEWLKAKKLRSKRIWEGQPKQRVKIPFSDKELRFVETPGLWRDEKMLGTPLTLQYLTGLSPWDVVGNEITTLGIRANLILHSVNSSVQNEIEKWAEGLTPEQKHELALMMDGQRPITPELAKQAEFLRNEILDKYRTDFGIGGYIPDYMPHVAVDSIDDLLAKQDEALAKQLEGVPGALDYFARHPRTDPDSELMFEDAFEAVSYWFYRGLKATVMDEFLHAIEDAKEIADPSRHKWLDEYGKMVIGVPGSEETFFNNLVAFAIGDPDYKGRHIKQVADTFTELWYDGAMMWNLHSPIKNLTQKSLTIGYLSDGANPAKGVYYWAKGVQMLTTKTGRELLKYSEVLNDRQFLEGIGEREKVLSKFFKPYQKFSEWGWKPYKLSDLSNVSEAYLAGVYKGLERGLSLEEAIRYGDEVVKNTQYTYGTSGLMLFKGPFSRMLGVVNSWPLNWMRLNMAMLQGKGTLPPKAKGEMRKVLEGLEDDLKRLDEEFGGIDSSFSSRKEASGEDFDFVNPSESYEDRFVTINGRKYSKFGVLRVGQTMVAMSLMAALFQKIFGVNFKSTTPKEVTKSSLPYKVATGEYWSPPHETLGKMLKSLESDNWDQLEEETKNWVLETIDSFVPASNARKRVSRVAEDILNEYWAEDKKHRQVYEKTPWEATRQLWGTPVERYERQNISAEIKSVYLKHFGLSEGKQASRQAFKKDLTEALTHAQKLGYTKEGIEKMAKNAESAVRSSAYNSLWEALEKRDQKEAYKAAMILAGSGANASTIRSSAKNRGIQPQLTNEALHLFNKAKAQIK